MGIMAAGGWASRAMPKPIREKEDGNSVGRWADEQQRHSFIAPMFSGSLRLWRLSGASRAERRDPPGVFTF